MIVNVYNNKEDLFFKLADVCCLIHVIFINEIINVIISE